MSMSLHVRGGERGVADGAPGFIRVNTSKGGGKHYYYNILDSLLVEEIREYRFCFGIRPQLH